MTLYRVIVTLTKAFQIEFCMLRKNSCKGNVVKESFKNATCFLCAFYHILLHNIWCNILKSIKIFRM